VSERVAVAKTRSPAHLAYGSALRELRGERGFSQERLADLAGLDRTYVSGIERGERNPSLTNLLKLADTLGVPLGDIATRAGLVATSTSRDRHRISYALERAAITLKGLNQDTTPITPSDTEHILHDAARLVAELIETLHHVEAQTSHKTGVLADLEAVLAKLGDHGRRS
jgi:transcriptional regulator with XRE-family HTH domain